MSVSLAKPSSTSSSPSASSSPAGVQKGRFGSCANSKRGDGYIRKSLKNTGTLKTEERSKGKGKEKEVYFPSVSDVDAPMDLSGENEKLQVYVKRERGSATPMIVNGSSSRGKGKG